MESLFEKGVSKEYRNWEFSKTEKGNVRCERLRMVMEGYIRKEVKLMTGAEEKVKYLVQS